MRRIVHAGPAARRRPKIELVDMRAIVMPDDDPDISFLEQEGFEDRLEQYQNGDFSFVGVRAEAEVEINGTVQTIKSGGIWGVESDSGKDYFDEIATEEWKALREDLLAIGVPSKQIPEFKRLEWRT